jgi:hypothetical protein
MPYTTYNIPAAIQGIDRDSERTLIAKSLSPYFKNMVVENTKVRKFLGYEYIGQTSLPLDGNGMEIINYTDARGVKHMIALTTTNAYLYNSANDEWDAITPVAGDFTGDDDDRWSHDVFTDGAFSLNGGDALLISNGTSDGIFIYQGQAADKFVAFDTGIASFVNAKEISSFWNYFFMWNYSLTNQVVRSWKRSAVGDMDDFSGAGSAFGTLTDSIGDIVRVKKLGYDSIIYSKNSITTGVKSGGVTTFEFPTLVYETGLFAPKAIWDFVNVHYFLGTDQKFYGYSGGQILNEIGLGIELTFFKSLNVSKKARITFGIDPNNHKLYCWYPDSSSEFGKSYYAYNYRAPIKSWEFGEFGHNVRDFSLFSGEVDYYTDSDLFAGIYTDETALYCDDSSLQSGYPLPVFIDSDGNTYKITESTGTFVGDPIDCEYQTLDFSENLEQFSSRFAWVAFNLMSLFTGDLVKVQYSTDQDIDNDIWTTLTDSPINLTKQWTEYRLPLDVVGRRICFRLVQDRSTDHGSPVVSSKDLQIRMARISAMALSEE